MSIDNVNVQFTQIATIVCKAINHFHVGVIQIQIHKIFMVLVVVAMVAIVYGLLLAIFGMELQVMVDKMPV